MEGFDGHPGTSRLARILSQRMKKENEAPLVMDFGEIQANGSLVTNTFPLPIPKGVALQSASCVKLVQSLS